jgi:hypothetical protein
MRRNREARSKAETLVADAQARGWRAKAEHVSHGDGIESRETQRGWTMIARRGDEVVTVTWFDEVAVGHVGWHSTPDRERSLSNQSEVRKIIDGSSAAD